jgi:hypothetical protein
MPETLSALFDQYAIWLLPLWWVFSAGVESMPSPGEADGKAYVWAYGFLNLLAGNVREAVAQKGWGSGGGK